MRKLLCFLFFLSGSIFANETFYKDFICWEEAGETYNVDPLILYSIAKVESDFVIDSVNYRSDSDKDVGLMQINSYWFESLSKRGIEPSDLITDPCLNVHVGAFVLAESIRIFGKTWRAIGAYNAGTGKGVDVEKRREIYAKRVRYRYVQLISGVRW